ncbi:MAG: outer membrane beta-barrel protein [Candidatus Angelobacter sp.]
MRLRAILFSALLCLPLLSFAQRETTQVPTRGTIYGGYSLLHANNDLGGSNIGNIGGSGFNLGGNNLNGWEGQGTFNFTPHFGVTADFSGNSQQLAGVSLLGFSAGTRQHIYNFLFGPTVTGYFGKSSVFGHALFGAAHSSLNAGVGVPILGGISAPLDSANAFAMAFGGGVDIGLTRHFAIRAAQVDFIRTNFNSTDALASGLATSTSNNQNSFRYSGGIIWRF